jgi:putative salt-induced outer membrane protein YdiY
MNKRLLTIAVVPAIVISLFIFIKYSTAGGVIDHTVTVINDTEGQANIILQTFNGDTQSATVNSRAEYKFHAGKKCPASLYGSVTVSNPYSGSTTKSILIHCIKSGQSTTDPIICSQLLSGDLNCKSSTHRLRPFDNYTTGRGYHFIKE